MTPTRGGFSLRKWYLDCVDEAGSAFIGYRARLRWGPLRLAYAAVLLAPSGVTPRQAQVVGRPPAPVGNADGWRWRCPRLGVDGHWQGTDTASSGVGPVHDLLTSPAGPAIRWHCHLPRSRARVRVEGGPTAEPVELDGLGYVEELELTVPPWRLPFDELRWGRFAAAERSLVWIAWQRREAATAVAASDAADGAFRFGLLDGRSVDLVGVDDRAVTCGAGSRLVVADGRPLREGSLVGNVLSFVPGLVERLPSRFGTAVEHKRLSRAVLQAPGEPPADGWAIHEVVRW